jgi:hypothetical protein
VHRTTGQLKDVPKVLKLSNACYYLWPRQINWLPLGMGSDLPDEVITK